MMHPRGAVPRSSTSVDRQSRCAGYTRETRCRTPVAGSTDDTIKCMVREVQSYKSRIKGWGRAGRVHLEDTPTAVNCGGTTTLAVVCYRSTHRWEEEHIKIIAKARRTRALTTHAKRDE